MQKTHKGKEGWPELWCIFFHSSRIILYITTVLRPAYLSGVSGAKRTAFPIFTGACFTPFLLTLPLFEAPKWSGNIRVGIVHLIFSQIQCNCGCTNYDLLLTYCVNHVYEFTYKAILFGWIQVPPFLCCFYQQIVTGFQTMVWNHIFLCRAHSSGRPADPNYHTGSRAMLVNKNDAYE